MKVNKEWKEFEVIETGKGEKLERWGNVTLLRPDPQIIWGEKIAEKKADAHYLRSESGGGKWKYISKVPEEWTIGWRNLKFLIKPMGFKHTGLFPEQATNWEMMIDLIQNAKRPINVLNLFAYTGGATVACASAGASVTHVDAAKNMVERCKQNAKASGLQDAPIRYIVDDCFKFVEREIRRGKKYDAIIMDPPSYGRGTGGEVWKLEENIADFVKLCSKVLTENPLFVLINSYTTGLGATAMENILRVSLKQFKGRFDSYEVGLNTREGLILPCGNSSVFIGEKTNGK